MTIPNFGQPAFDVRFVFVFVQQEFGGIASLGILEKKYNRKLKIMDEKVCFSRLILQVSLLKYSIKQYV
jgi:hypothetical protein